MGRTAAIERNSNYTSLIEAFLKNVRFCSSSKGDNDTRGREFYEGMLDLLRKCDFQGSERDTAFSIFKRRFNEITKKEPSMQLMLTSAFKRMEESEKNADSCPFRVFTQLYLQEVKTLVRTQDELRKYDPHPKRPRADDKEDHFEVSGTGRQKRKRRRRRMRRRLKRVVFAVVGRTIWQMHAL